MNDVTRSILVIVIIALVFLGSWFAFTTIDNSYRMNEPERVIKLKNEVDSLETLLEVKIDSLKDAKELIKELQGDNDE